MNNLNNLEELRIWVEVLDTVRSNTEDFDRFERDAIKLIASTIKPLEIKIKSLFKDLQKKTGFDWSCYLNDIDFFDWSPGDLQQAVEKHAKDRILDACQKLTTSPPGTGPK